MQLMCKYDKEIGAGFAPPNGAIWDEYNEIYHHQTQKNIQCQILTFSVQIRAHFDRDWAIMLSNLSY